MEKKDILEKNKHILTIEVLQDITDTEREIEDMTKEAEHLEGTPHSSTDFRINSFRASAKRTGIEERKEFIASLRKLIYYRTEI